MGNVNYMRVVPNSHSFGSLKNILVSHEIQPDELTKDYLITGFKNTLKREYELKEFGEPINNEPVFSSVNQIIQYLECLAFDSNEFVSIINNTLYNNFDLKCKIKMKRTEIYKNIDGERDYQDENWGTRRQMDGTPDEEKPVAEWINYIEHHVNKAKERVYRLDTEGATHELRKVAALAVRAMEIHGCPERLTLLDTNLDEGCCDNCK